MTTTTTTTTNNDIYEIVELVRDVSQTWKQRKKPDLRSLCILLRLKVGGTKDEIITRIARELHRISAAIQIQRIFRGFLVRCMQQLRGPGFPFITITASSSSASSSSSAASSFVQTKNPLVVNECDFYTLVPFQEMSPHLFFSYEDDSHFVYAFDVTSLMTMYRKNRRLLNPYNRKDIPFDIVCKFFRLYTKIQLLLGSSLLETTTPVVEDAFGFFKKRKRSSSSSSSSSSSTVAPTTLSSSLSSSWAASFPHSDTVQQPQRQLFPRNNDYLTYAAAAAPNAMGHNQDNGYFVYGNEESRLEASQRILKEIKDGRTISQRIEDVFMEIDRLGNYTQSQWFRDFNDYEYAAFYERYYRLWHGNTDLSASTKLHICAHPDPFPFPPQRLHAVNAHTVITSTMTTLPNARLVCLEIMEWMIYTGVDIEHRRLGALHCLLILSRLSSLARRSLPFVDI